ncbi:hypothetical protein LTR78_010213 [Recurvomyces mirabilis]|uniref:Involucrin repeat protein n=1 Tax=Recurvomyces mirabilis TaxID=574656 RepID=A0AAE0TMS8_9PEZI|nr:hypothetical protein LTR78_010213 [Recurvomyces mirabilis]KAK5149679.1 hypothetical protein LTS14_010740 [Recurvomyces mirabilis]
MWKAFSGRSESGSTSGVRRKKSSSGRASASEVGVPSSSHRSEDGSRKHRSSKSMYGDDEGRSATTPTRSGTNGPFSLTESAVRALGDGDDDWEDDKDARGEKRSRQKSSRSEKERSRSRDRKERKRESTKESGKSEKSRGKSRAEDIVDGPSDARGIPAMGSFDQFPGQNSGALVGPVSQQSQSQSQSHAMSGALPSADPAHQFPQQIPAKFSRPRLGPTRADSFGHASEYYLDEGQSVDYQPGVRSRTPNMLVNPDLHLHAASAAAQETPDTGHGSAADYYGGAADPVPTAETRPVQPTRKSSKSTGKVSSLAKIASTSAAAAVTAGVFSATTNRPSTSQPVTPSRPSRSDPADLRPASSYYAPSSAPQQRTTGKSSARTNSNPPAYAAGGAAAGLGAYETSQRSDQRESSYTNTSYRTETQAGQTRSLFGTDERSYNDGGNTNQNFQYHEHKGPMTRLKDGFFNLISDPDDVRRMEEYTEYIGVCKHCFDPRSTPNDGPRQHHYHRRPSEDSFEDLRRRKSYERMQRKNSSETMRRRVDKESRYYSERDRREQSSRSNVLGAGLAAAGVAAGANALFTDRKDFDDTYSVKSGHRASSAMRRRSRSSSRERRRRTEHGVTRRDSSTEYVTVRTKDGKLERRRSSRERKDGFLGAAAGAAIGVTAASAFTGDSRQRRDQAQGEFVRHRDRNTPNGGYTEIRRRDERREDEGTGILGSFFSPSQNERKYRNDGRERRGKPKSFFGFGDGSSSSDEDLNFGEGSSSKTNLPLRRKRSGRSARRRSSENIAATVVGIGVTAAALAAAQKGHRLADRNSRPELGARKDVKVHHDGRTYRPSDEEEWEDELPSDVDDASSTHSGLAFGNGSRLSHRQSLESVSSGDGLSAWGWRWGGKDKKKKRRSSSPDPVYPPDRRQQVLDDHMHAQQTNGGAPGIYTSPTAVYQQPMQYVDPQPVSEGGSRHASMPGSWDAPNGRPGPAPLQQPQPIAPVSPAVMEDVVHGRPIPRRTASSPTRPSFGLTDAALIGAGALAAGSIIAGQGRARKDSNVRFGLTDEQQQREDRQRRRDREDAEDERRRADRTRALKDEAGRHAKEEDAKRREEDVRRRREEENRVAAEASLERERIGRQENERKAELERQRSRELQETEQRRLEDEGRAQEQSRRQWEAMAAEEAAREKQTKRAREARIQEEIDAKQRELDQQAEERRRAGEAREAREQGEEDKRMRDEEDRRSREESSRKPERFEDAPPPRQSSSGWSNVAMGTAAAATVGAVMAGAEHGRNRQRNEDRAREHDSHPEGQALYHPIQDSEPIDYSAKQILPDQETSGTPIMDDDLFDKDFFKRKRSDSEYARVATNAREADKVVSDMDDYYSKPAPSQADFFAPKDILSQDSAGKTAVAGPNADNDAQIYYGADAELRSRFGDGYGKSKHAPYGVPALNVISPTPPPSSPAFGARSKPSLPPSALAQTEEVGQQAEEGASQSGKRDRSRSISWGEDRTHVYDPPTPESFQERGSYMEAKDVPTASSRNDSAGLDEVIVEAEEPGRKSKTTSYKAADLEREAEENRRQEESRASSTSKFADRYDASPAETLPSYKQPFYESVSDIGMGRFAVDTPGTEGAPQVRGFVEGETDEPTPVVEGIPHIPGGFDDDDEVQTPVPKESVQTDISPSWEPPLSKKDQKKREKAAKLAAAAMEAEAFDDTPTQQVQTVDTAEEEPADYFAAKKDKKSKKGKKGAKFADTFDSEPVETTTPTVTETERSAPLQNEEEAIDYAVSKKDKKKSKKAARFADTFDSDPSEPSTPIVKDAEPLVQAPAEDDADFFISKKDKKKRDKAAKLASAFDSDPAVEEVEPPAQEIFVDPVTPAGDKPSDFFMSKKDKKKRDKALQRGLSDFSPAVEDTKPGNLYDESPSTEVTASDADFTPALSKKEQKNRDKEMEKQGFADVADTLAATTGIAALVGGAAALASDSSPAEPEDEWGTPTSGKKSKKGKKKGAGLERDIRDIEPSETPVTNLPSSNERPSMPGNWVSETIEKAAETPADAYDPFQYQVKNEPPPALQDNEASADDFTTSSSKKSKKKKRDSGRFNEPVAASPLRSEWKYDDYIGEQPAQVKAGAEAGVTAEPQSYANGHAVESSTETRDVDAGRGGQSELYRDNGVDLPDRRESPTSQRSGSRTLEPAQRSDESEHSSRRKARSEVGYADDPDYYDDRSVAGSEPVGYYDSSTRSKRRSRHEDDDDDAKSTVSSRSRREKEEPTSSKKEKKGGLFGLFSRKSADTVPLSRQSTHSDEAPLSRTSTRDAGEEDDERKHRKKKHREGSVYDDDDTRSVTSESRRKKHHHRDDDDVDSQEKSRSSRHGDDDFDTRSESGHRHRHHRDDNDDDDTISRAGTERGHTQHRRKRTGGSESNDQSFLGDRVEDLPPLPASPPESPILASVNHEQGSGKPVSAESDTRAVFPEFAAVDNQVVGAGVDERGAPDDLYLAELPAGHDDSTIIPQDHGEQLPALPASHPGSPTAASAELADKQASVRRHKPTLSWAEDVQDSFRSDAAVDTPERPGLTGRPASATAVPLRFPFGHAPPQPLKERSLSFGTPTQSSTPTSPTSSHKKPRPTSSEIRPLYLVERNRKVPDVEEEDMLPSLPSSKPSSRASSVQGSDDWHSAIEDPPSPCRERSLRIDTSHAHAFQASDDYLDSQQNTPKASDFPETAFERPTRQEPQFYTWEDFEQDERMHDHDLEPHNDMPVQASRDAARPPLYVEHSQERTVVLPPLPDSPPSSPENEVKLPDIKPRRSAKALAAAAMFGGAALLAHQTMQSDDNEESEGRTPRSSKFKEQEQDFAEERLPLPASVEPEELMEGASNWPAVTRMTSKKKGTGKQGAKQSTEEIITKASGANLVTSDYARFNGSPAVDHSTGDDDSLPAETLGSGITEGHAAEPAESNRELYDLRSADNAASLSKNAAAAMASSVEQDSDVQQTSSDALETETWTAPALARKQSKKAKKKQKTASAFDWDTAQVETKDRYADTAQAPVPEISSPQKYESVPHASTVRSVADQGESVSTDHRFLEETFTPRGSDVIATAAALTDLELMETTTNEPDTADAPALTRKESKKAKKKQKATSAFKWGDSLSETPTDQAKAAKPTHKPDVSLSRDDADDRGTVGDAILPEVSVEDPVETSTPVTDVQATQTGSWSLPGPAVVQALKEEDPVDAEPEASAFEVPMSAAARKKAKKDKKKQRPQQDDDDWQRILETGDGKSAIPGVARELDPVQDVMSHSADIPRLGTGEVHTGRRVTLPADVPLPQEQDEMLIAPVFDASALDAPVQPTELCIAARDVPLPNDKYEDFKPVHEPQDIKPEAPNFAKFDRGPHDVHLPEDQLYDMEPSNTLERDSARTMMTRSALPGAVSGEEPHAQSQLSPVLRPEDIPLRAADEDDWRPVDRPKVAFSEATRNADEKLADLQVNSEFWPAAQVPLPEDDEGFIDAESDHVHEHIKPLINKPKQSTRPERTYEDMVVASQDNSDVPSQPRAFDMPSEPPTARPYVQPDLPASENAKALDEISWESTTKKSKKGKEGSKSKAGETSQVKTATDMVQALPGDRARSVTPSAAHDAVSSTDGGQHEPGADQGRVSSLGPDPYAATPQETAESTEVEDPQAFWTPPESTKKGKKGKKAQRQDLSVVSEPATVADDAVQSYTPAAREVLSAADSPVLDEANSEPSTDKDQFWSPLPKKRKGKKAKQNVETALAVEDDGLTSNGDNTPANKSSSFATPRDDRDTEPQFIPAPASPIVPDQSKFVIDNLTPQDLPERSAADDLWEPTKHSKKGKKGKKAKQIGFEDEEEPQTVDRSKTAISESIDQITLGTKRAFNQDAGDTFSAARGGKMYTDKYDMEDAAPQRVPSEAAMSGNNESLPSPSGIPGAKAQRSISWESHALQHDDTLHAEHNIPLPPVSVHEADELAVEQAFPESGPIDYEDARSQATSLEEPKVVHDWDADASRRGFSMEEHGPPSQIEDMSNEWPSQVVGKNLKKGKNSKGKTVFKLEPTATPTTDEEREFALDPSFDIATPVPEDDSSWAGFSTSKKTKGKAKKSRQLLQPEFNDQGNSRAALAATESQDPEFALPSTGIAQRPDSDEASMAKHTMYREEEQAADGVFGLPPLPESPLYADKVFDLETVPEPHQGSTLRYDHDGMPPERCGEHGNQVGSNDVHNEQSTSIPRDGQITDSEQGSLTRRFSTSTHTGDTLTEQDDRAPRNVQLQSSEGTTPVESNQERAKASYAEVEPTNPEQAESGLGARMSKAIIGAAAVTSAAVLGTSLADDEEEAVPESTAKFSKKDKKKAKKRKGAAFEYMDTEPQVESEEAVLPVTNHILLDRNDDYVPLASRRVPPASIEEELLEQALARDLPAPTPGEIVGEGEAPNVLSKKSKKEKRNAKKVRFSFPEINDTSSEPTSMPASRDEYIPVSSVEQHDDQRLTAEPSRLAIEEATPPTDDAMYNSQEKAPEIEQDSAVAKEWPTFAIKRSKKDKKKARAKAGQADDVKIEDESYRPEDVPLPRPTIDEASQEISPPCDLATDLESTFASNDRRDDPKPTTETWLAPEAKKSVKDKRKGKNISNDLWLSDEAPAPPVEDEGIARTDPIAENAMHNAVDTFSAATLPDDTPAGAREGTHDVGMTNTREGPADNAEEIQADADLAIKVSKKDRRNKKKNTMYMPEVTGVLDNVPAGSTYDARMNWNEAPTDTSIDDKRIPPEAARHEYAEPQTRIPQDVVMSNVSRSTRDNHHEDLDGLVDRRASEHDELLSHTTREVVDDKSCNLAASNDIDFAATLAAGLADAGFNPDLVVNDPAYHRRASPPATMAEANPEEEFTAFTTKRKKKGKNGKRIDDSQSVAEPTVQELDKRDPIPSSGMLSNDAAVDAFDTDLALTMQQSGFDSSAIERALASNEFKSSDTAPDDDGADLSFAVSRRKKKGKKQTPIAESSESRELDATSTGAFISKDRTTVDKLPAQAAHGDIGHVEDHAQILPSTNIGTYEAAELTREALSDDAETIPSHGTAGNRSIAASDPAEYFPVDNKQEMDVDEMDKAYSAFKKKERRKNKKRQQVAEPSTGSTSIEDSREHTPIDDDHAFSARHAGPASQDPIVGASHRAAREFHDTTKMPHALNSLDRLADFQPQARGATEMPSLQEWSFDALDKDKTSLANASDSQQPRNMVRDSGYQSIDSPVVERHHHDSAGPVAPELHTIQSHSSLRSRRSAEPLHIDTPSSPAWPLEVAKRGSSTRDALTAPRTSSKEPAATPLESTTKNRASYLFTSPPAQLRDTTDPFENHTSARSQAYDALVGDSTHDDASTPRQESHSQDHDEQHESYHRNLGPLSPRTPLQVIEEESGATKRSKADTDVGGPAVIKARRRSETPQAIRTSRESFSSAGRPSVIIPATNLRHASSPLSTDELINRLSWPAVDEDRDTVNIDRSLQRDTPKPMISGARSPSVLSNRSSTSVAHHYRSPADQRSFSRNSNRSLTPTLRRIDRSQSGDLRAASRRSESGSAVGARASTPKTIPFEAPPTPPSNDEDLIVAGAAGAAVMSDVFQGYGDARGLQSSPTRPPSVRKRQSMHIVDLESKLGQLEAENRALSDARNAYEQSGDTGSLAEALEARDLQLQEREVEINRIQTMLGPLHEEIERLNDINGELTEANRNLVDDTNGRYATLQAEHAHAHEQWQSTNRELDQTRETHSRANEGLRDAVEVQVTTALAEKNAEILRLREELDIATEQIRALQVQIQASKSRDFLTVRDEDYFDGACQKLCQHVQQWVLRFSKLSDNRVCRLSTELRDDKIEARLDNAILDGSDADKLLGDRIRRRDVFMSVVMTMVWEYIFTRYLFGMDREQRQKLKALEKILAEVGPPRAVAQWRATTFTLLSKRPDFARQCALDTEAVAQEVFALLCALLPPPSNAEQQLRISLLKVMGVAADLAIEMRTQRAGYIMLPPLQPEYDTNGDLVRKVHFNASLMNERSGMFSSNEELESERGVVKLVLFPLVVKKGDENGEGEEEIVVCPAQVLVHNENGRGKKVVRVMSGAMEIDDPRRSSRLSLVSTAPGSTAF